MYPILFHFGHIALPTFGVLAAVGVMCGLWLSLTTARLVELAPDEVWDAGVVLVVAAFVASRVLLVAGSPGTFLRYPVLLLAVPSLTPVGLLLAAGVTLGWLVWKKLPVLRVLDAWAPCGLVVWGFLGLGHWAEGSDPGVSGEPGLWVALVGLGLGVGLLAVLGRQGVERINADKSGWWFGWGLVLAGLGQFLIGFLREPGVGVLGMDVLEWVALGMVAGGGGLVFWRARGYPRG